MKYNDKNITQFCSQLFATKMFPNVSILNNKDLPKLFFYKKWEFLW